MSLLLSGLSKKIKKYRSFIFFQLILATLIIYSSIGKEALFQQLMHSAFIVLICPLLCIYLPFKRWRKAVETKGINNFSYIFILSIFCAITINSYTYFLKKPGSALVHLKYKIADPNVIDDSSSFSMQLTLPDLKNSHDLYDSNTFIAEGFVHSLTFCFFSICHIFFVGWRHKVRLNKSLKIQQLAILIQQLNPHFLFNSLNSIRAMLYEDKKEAKQLLKEFRSLFKHHFENKAQFSSIESEISLCKHYLQLEKVRLEERLNLLWQVDQKAEKAEIPTMSLFTLVENAIKHGIAPLPNGGVIKIKIRVYRGKVTVTVSNPILLGFKAEGTQTGLENLKRRLTLIYDQKASIEKTVEENSYHIKVIYPYKPFNKIDFDSQIEEQI